MSGSRFGGIAILKLGMGLGLGFLKHLNDGTSMAGLGLGLEVGLSDACCDDRWRGLLKGKFSLF
jgi:hypothetical protein